MSFAFKKKYIHVTLIRHRGGLQSVYYVSFSAALLNTNYCFCVLNQSTIV